MKKLLYLLIVFIPMFIIGKSSVYAQGVGVNSSGSNPNPSALLDIDVTGINPKKGLLIPRMTTGERDGILSPAEALLIFNTTTKCFETYEGFWQTLWCSCSPPAAPTAGTNNSTSADITWNWNAVSGATGYKYNTTNNYASATNNGTSTSFTQTGISCNSTYSLYVWTYNTCGNSSSTPLTYTTGGGGDIWSQINAPAPSNYNIAYAAAVDGSGLYVVGYDQVSGTKGRIEKRDLNTGALISSFGSGGAINASVSGSNFNAVAVNASALFVVGYDQIPGHLQWRIEKRDLATGTLVSGFGSGGVVNSNPSSYNNAYAVALDATSLYAVGFNESSGNYIWRIEKRDLNTGSLSWSQTSNGSVNGTFAYGIAVDGSGVYMVGYDGNGGNEIRIEKRDLSTGALISGFGSGGVILSNPSSGSDVAFTVGLDATGIYVVGSDHSPGDDEWRIEKRDLTTGVLISSFGTGGVVTNNPSSGSDEIQSGVAIDATALYVSGYDNSPGQYEWHIEKRNLSTGTLVPSFGTGGVVIDPTVVGGLAHSLATDGGGVYVVGDDWSTGNARWKMKKICK